MSEYGTFKFPVIPISEEDEKLVDEYIARQRELRWYTREEVASVTCTLSPSTPRRFPLPVKGALDDGENFMLGLTGSGKLYVGTIRPSWMCWREVDCDTARVDLKGDDGTALVTIRVSGEGGSLVVTQLTPQTNPPWSVVHHPGGQLEVRHPATRYWQVSQCEEE